MIITHCAKSLGTLNTRYEMIPLAVTYNVASIIKMGYKDHNSNGIFVKVKRASGEDDNGDEQAPTAQGSQAQASQVEDPVALSLVNIMHTLDLTRDGFEKFQGKV